MKQREVLMVRVYCSEGESRGGEPLMKRLLARLHDVERVRGVTVFRGITGFGQSGRIHSSSLIDLGLDLPLVIEFFDEPVKVRRILSHLKDILPPGHVVSWLARVNDPGGE